MEIRNLSGLRFGRWVVLDDRKFEKKKSYWLCKCDCGTVKFVAMDSLTLGKSTGCSKCRNRYSKHNLSGSKLYYVLRSMKARCFNPKTLDYHNYGGRGITVCDEWKDDFQLFYDWAMANGYQEHLTIERVNNDGNYEPSNCKWITFKENQSNKRTNRNITFDGHTRTLQQWSSIIGIGSNSLHDRIKNHGVEVALSHRGNMRGRKL